MPRRAYDTDEDLMLQCPRCAGSGFEPATDGQVDPQVRAYAIDADGHYVNCTGCDGEGRVRPPKNRRSRSA